MSLALESCTPAHRRAALRLSDFFALARQRRALARLDAEQLNDLGLSRQDAMDEAQRPVWDVPNHWVR